MNFLARILSSAPSPTLPPVCAGRWRGAALALLLVAATVGCTVQIPDATRFGAIDADATGQADAADISADTGNPTTDTIQGGDADSADISGPCPGGCDDQNPCTEDKCGTSGSCEHATADGASCDDGNACVTGATCAGGKCQGGKAKVCDDNNPCTADACLPAKGCTHTDDDGAGCDDNDACTLSDKCLAGKCTGAAKSCGADDCNNAKCINGNCVAAPKLSGLSCDDGDACTDGTKCDGKGLCQGGAIASCDDGNACTQDSCDSKDGCVHALASAPCSDNDACTVGDACAAGTCKPGSAKQCDDGNGCTNDLCNPVDGACGATPSTDPCSDGNACTTGDACQGGKCQPGPAAGCNDSNPCTIDSCDPSTGACSYTANSASCDDGDLCTVGDICQEGKCNPGAAKQCADKDICTSDTCSAKTGECSYTAIAGCGATCTNTADCKGGDVCNTPTCLSGKCAFLPTTATCDDGDACSVADTCQSGVCKGLSSKNCDDGNPCTDDACSKGTCVATPNTAPCNDNNACSLGDACQAGNCAPGSAKVCDDGNPCTSDACDPQSGSCASTANSAPCDDKNPCTQGDLCSGGSCLAGSSLNCDDGNLCTNDACDAKSGKCVASNSSAPCSDGDACSQGDTCDGGACVSGTPKVCDDLNPCTNDSCDAATAACANLPNAATCTDGDACTVGDGCTGGACKVGAAKVCADSDTCTNDACDSASGNCVFKPISGCGGNCQGVSDCNDSNPCTSDTCVGAKCAFPANTATCDDGNGCTVGDACTGGTCKAGSPKACDDGNPCTTDACDSKTGNCTTTANTANCDDGNACTAGDLCGSGNCKPGKPITCNDGNSCTDDACNPADGKCTTTSNTAACDDSNACTVGDVCSLGTCKPGATKSCDDSNPCTSDACNPADGKCSAVNNTATCSDSNACTQGDVCLAGACKPGAAKSCDDGKICTDDNCDKASGVCLPTANTAACDDGNKCTLSDTCGQGACVPGASAKCDDGDACTSDSCNPSDGKCLFAPKVGCGGNCSNAADCSDGNACTDDQCSGGKCAFPSNTANCDDSNPCTSGDSCSGGSCKGGAAKNCDDTNPCTNDACNAADGTCSHINNSATCSDNNACTLGDACVAGSCKSGAAKSCDDTNPCTNDACAPADGTCSHINNTASCDDKNACTSGDLCSAGACVGPTTVNCDDAKVCTTDSCDKTAGCQHVNNTLPCSDGNACTTSDACTAGNCVGGAAPNCDDSILCTSDSCDKTAGCLHANNTIACSDGNACTQNDACAGGQCVAGALYACDDKDQCTSDSCNPSDGACVYKPIIGCGGNCANAGDCNDSNPCTDDACASGKCTNSNNTATCNDNNACTTKDACSGGACVGGPAPSCDDGKVCTTDSCDKSAGCVNTNNTVACSDGSACTTGDLCGGGICVGGAAPNCDDNNVCTIDSCDASAGCTHDKSGKSCDDGNACTGSDTCVGVQCVGSSIDCNDKNECTQDLCDKSAGCQYTALTNGATCDDGNPCSIGDNCQGGTCKYGNLVWVDTLAGQIPNPNPGWNAGSVVDGTGDKARFNTPSAIVFSPKAGALFVADAASNVIRKVTLQGVVTTFAGTANVSGVIDAGGTAAAFSLPLGLAVDGPGNILVADATNARIRKIASDGNVTTLIGLAGSGFVDGNASKAKLLSPKGVAVSSTGLVAIADTGNHAIRIWNGTILSTLAGSGTAGFQDGGGALAKFDSPVALAFGPGGNLFVADMNNHRIRRITPSGAVATVAGDGTGGFLDSSTPTTARFYYPTGIVVAPGSTGSTLFITDSFNARIRRGSANGVSTFAGGGSSSADGAANTAGFNQPAALTFDSYGNLYIADSYNHTIRRVRDSSSPCNLSGTCAPAGWWNPVNNCQWCQAANNPNGWTSKAQGDGCDDGSPCTPNDACTATGSCIGTGVACNDGNVCTSDICDPTTATCSATAASGSCDDGMPCTSGDYCASSTCNAGADSPCNDNNPCTTDACAGSAATCSHTNVQFGTSCSAGAGVAYSFCSAGKCTGVEQSSLVQAGSATGGSRLTGIARGPDNNVVVSGFGAGSTASQSALWTVTTSTSPPTLNQTMTATPKEFWGVAYRLIAGGQTTFPTPNDTAAGYGAYAAASGWLATNGPAVGGLSRILRHVAGAIDPGTSNEYYWVGGNTDGSTSGSTTTLSRLMYTASSSTWQLTGSLLGKIGAYNTWITDSTQCGAQLVPGNIAGLYATGPAEAFVAMNTTATPAVGRIGLWQPNQSMNNTCAGLTPGGAVLVTPSQSGWAFTTPQGVTLTGIHGANNSKVLAVGYTSQNMAVVYKFTGTNSWIADTPTPTMPSGWPTFASGTIKPTAVLVRDSEAWVAGVATNTCNYMFALHATASGTNWLWDKMIISNATAVNCDTSHPDHLSVTRIWSDPSDGAVYITGSAAKDTTGGTTVTIGMASQGQMGVLWRIK